MVLSVVLLDIGEKLPNELESFILLLANIYPIIYCYTLPATSPRVGRLRYINRDSGHPRVFIEQCVANF